ncbi:MAG: DMT family transporter [Acidobacteria bacterium]|nr:DMT family transporter [Acidobacteriota bacterium]
MSDVCPVEKPVNPPAGRRVVPAGARAALLVACLFWAASFVATKVALAAAPPLTVVTLRLLVSAACFAVWFAVRRRRFSPVTRADGWRLVWLSLFGTGLHYGIQTVGLQYTTASNGSVYAVTGPLTITLLAVIFLGERLTWRKTAGIALALTGVLVVIGVETLLAFDLTGHLLGDLLVFASIFMWGVFTVLGKDTMQRLDALELTARVTFIGAAYMIPASVAEMVARGWSPARLDLGAGAAIAFLGVTCSFLATLLYFFALERTESQKAGVYFYTIPPLTYVMAWLWLGEQIGLNLVMGVLLVLVGVYLTERG